ncbi:MAG: hypothetical protein DI556_14805 [Rhodovulum sulfidophilum]|uniref:DUF58 domain-containing protein n=1 Tax=Rhodovulum sulfidophilum TaxID=35806 RepID=A0A2W5N7W3_RHOSU|nr:MAG: hypothetical protein DI556_14805 [Rhodovulum sulfidophilum]
MPAPAIPPEEEADLLALAEGLRWSFARRLSGARPGAHRGRWAGSEGVFADLAPLTRQPDPRRLDLRRSLADPFDGVHVRRFATPAPAVAHVVVDLSASLGALGATDRRHLAALLAGALAGAARLAGDAAALSVAAGAAAETLFQPGRDRGRVEAFRRAIMDAPTGGRGVAGLVALAATIPAPRAVVFLLSDFELAPDALAELLAAYEAHALIPLWLRDSGLETAPGGEGRLPRLARFTDPETGAARSALLTRARRRDWARRRAAAREALAAVFHAHGRDPVEITDRIEIERLTEDLARRPA